MDSENEGPAAAPAAEPVGYPRVTKEQIDALMERVSCIGSSIEGTTVTIVHAFLDGTFFLGSAESACVSPENFDEELGLQIAHRKLAAQVEQKLWEFEGYRLYCDIREGRVTVPAPPETPEA